MKEEEIDVLHLRLIREDKERSRALPREYYGDPAKSVTFESEKKPVKNCRMPKKGK
jgi:hypothetical protein